jgi:hypothetical protein
VIPDKNTEAFQATLRGRILVARYGHSFFSARHGAWQLGLLTITPTRLMLASFWFPRFRYELPMNAIGELIIWQRCVLGCIQLARLQIVHNLPEMPQYVIFATISPGKLTSALKRPDFKTLKSV